MTNNFSTDKNLTKTVNASTDGIVFNIQHYCIHDGPGIRTGVFLKGCPLRCLWYANPDHNAHTLRYSGRPERAPTVVPVQPSVRACPLAYTGCDSDQPECLHRMRLL